ncbi:metal-dependent hydrolase [Marinovum sp.]|uniref:metal-dependent hydrolase n=1 Tax=Marinovum sp. TaxID=2024839 RepID=UPI002B273C73|nr:metal-dependent hydrolase [Marinovum sp.]
MQLTWLGHGSFRLDSGAARILIDPWLTGNPMLEESQHDAATEGATHILLTHCHFDHVVDVLPLARKLEIPVIGQFDVMKHWGEHENVETIGFNKGGTVEAAGVRLTMVPASHSSSFGSDSGPQAAGSEVGYMIAAEDKVIYLSGDTTIMADMDWMGDYHKPQIGILSAGGHFTMDMKAAGYAAKRYFNFETVIPCHYRTFPILEQSAQALKDALPGVTVIEPEVLTAIEL